MNLIVIGLTWIIFSVSPQVGCSIEIIHKQINDAHLVTSFAMKEENDYTMYFLSVSLVRREDSSVQRGVCRK